MHKRSKYGRKKKDKGIFRPDVTINAFANSNPNQHSGVRERKSAASKVIDRKVMTQEVEQLSWFEKDLEDFDLDLQADGENGEEEEESSEASCEKVLPEKIRKKKKRHESNNDGVTYPIDLWIVLADHILPETIGSFARICRGANTVIHTVQFWKNILRRFYIEDPDLPDQLILRNIDSIHGLRTNVIKLFYHVYKPLSDRVRKTNKFDDEPHSLVGQRCLLTWHKKEKNMWKFYFKFRRGDEVDLSSTHRRSINSPAFHKWHQDLFYNVDDKCFVLEVTCPNFVRQPIVMGLILNRVYFNVSSGSMQYHKIKLILDSNFKEATVRNQNGMVELVLDPVYEVRVYPWWDPNFHISHSLIENEA